MFTTAEIELAMQVLAVTQPCDPARKCANELLAHHLTDTINAAAQRVIASDETEKQ